MSRVKVSFLVFGLVAVAAIVLLFAGTSELIAASKTSSCASVTAVKACPFSAASAQEDGKGKCSGETKSAYKSACKSSCKLTCKSACKSSCKSACSSACKSSCKSACSSACKSSCKSASKSDCKSACKLKAASIDDLPREYTRIVLTGRYVCGFCNLCVTEKCQPGFQTKDGKNYLLVKNNLTKKLRKASCCADVEIVSRVRKYGGVKYLDIDVVRPVS